MEITKQELINLLNQVEKQTFVHIVMETKLRMNKTGNPYFDLITKRSSGNYLIGTDYEKRVNSNMSKEGVEEPNFEVEPPKGKRHISKCVLIDTKTETVHYLMMERFDEVKPQVEYLMDGDPIEKQLFQDYMVKVYKSMKQTQDRKVTPITPKIDNIKEMSIDGMKYEVIHEVVHEQV